jgi:alpha-D-ribose 1-methylphosphonate 5-triphosphate synthase subunit PhnH
MTTAHLLSGGFADAPVQSARAFREVLEAIARPGTIRRVEGAAPPAPLSVAAGVALLTLTDSTTRLHLAGAADCPDLRDWIAFHIGAPLVAAEQADFALGTWEALQPVARFSVGQPDYPDRSATLIVEQGWLTNHGPALTGPGIETVAWLNLPETAAFRANRALFPLGFDTIFTSGDRIAALPRSTRVEAI